MASSKMQKLKPESYMEKRLNFQNLHAAPTNEIGSHANISTSMNATGRQKQSAEDISNCKWIPQTRLIIETL